MQLKRRLLPLAGIGSFLNSKLEAVSRYQDDGWLQTSNHLYIMFLPPKKGNALNLGETVLLEEEINPLLTELRKRKIIVTAIHNHWLFDDPRAMYMHFESVEPPLEFAKKIREAFKVLKD
ncbi:DUF1259 domain-containing protein [Pseudoneobacillus rhizosphaerae]|uniref:DUF1259 domain-containing protein n=1 Tax=Pseudoneobacillus rhizosphaerae TaxID=2880968 RepID=A0A9C7GBW9_9BACI|nr:DUF1259 domain-containing protein [Pseudoneobacillus rhizosphaerae]CAG9609398.1 hypothetical protein NEOCIP111885_03140 [Pseudoneobacillus rhizosphaerae]